jgi:uncharacterized alpha-E superfamily protein
MSLSQCLSQYKENINKIRELCYKVWENLNKLYYKINSQTKLINRII